MKRTIPIETFLLLMLIGIIIGLAYSRWAFIETQIANHAERLSTLENEHKKRLQLKRAAGRILEFVVHCFHKMTPSLLKSI
jgi:uncharacterized protein HemX